MNKHHDWDQLFSQTERTRTVGSPTDPAILQELSANQDFAHEDEIDIQEGLAWGREKERLLRWVRDRMALKLSQVERESITLCYFNDKTVRHAAVIIGCHYSTVSRAVHRAEKKLRAYAEGQGVTYKRRFQPKKKTKTPHMFRTAEHIQPLGD